MHSHCKKERLNIKLGIYGNRPITVGQGYSTIAWIPEDAGSWALPLRHERITSWETPIDKAVWQLKQACKYLPTLTDFFVG